jgi:hypothetical protein
MTTTRPSTYREIDSSPIEMEQALQEWAVAARPELERVAHSYGEVVSYRELAEAVQRSTGIRTRKLMHHWIGDVLGRVSAECHARGEPLLAALCVQKDGAIGDGYGVALVKNYGGDPPDDLELHAAEERLRCYRHFGAVMPADGGRAQLTPEVTARRRKAAKQAREDAPKATCPTCNIVLPAMGHCYYCDG